MILKNKKNKRTRLIALICLLALLLIAAAAAMFFIDRDQKESTVDISRAGTDAIQDKTNLAPATDEEKRDGEATKINNIEQSSGSNGTLSPTLLSAEATADRVVARGYVGGITENNGLCEFVFRKDSSTITKKSQGRADATTTVCPSVSFPKSELSPGSWTVSLRYTSGSQNGVSDSLKMEIQ